MWKVELVDIMGNGLIVGFNTNVDTLPEAELIAANEIGKHLSTNQVSLVHTVHLVYEAWVRNEIVGAVHIRSL